MTLVLKKEELIKIINEAIIHGGDCGGPYFINKEGIEESFKGTGHTPIFDESNEYVSDILLNTHICDSAFNLIIDNINNINNGDIQK